MRRTRGRRRTSAGIRRCGLLIPGHLGSGTTTSCCSTPCVRARSALAVTEIRKFERLGVEHLVFDFRFKFSRWFDQIELLGTQVLPKFR
jgi:hypothetical protein